MLLDLNQMHEVTNENVFGGEGKVSVRMYRDARGKMAISRIHPDSSTGLHRHETNSEYCYILSGTGTAICDGQQEALSPGMLHYCPKGSAHRMINTGADELVMVSIVPEC